MPSTDAYILNLSFGKVLDKPYKFRWSFKELSNLIGEEVNIEFELFNTVDQLENEKRLEKYHYINNKQNMEYNPRYSLRTGTLTVIYPDFPPEYAYPFTEQVGMFVHKVLAYTLGFFQRRRVIFGTPRLTSTKLLVYAMPPFFSGDLMDSNGYGTPLIAYEYTENYLINALNNFSRLSTDKALILMLLKRYNETLNLPYTYERVEAYLRILESLGKKMPNNPTIEDKRNAICILRRNGKKSDTLRNLIAPIVEYNLEHTDKDINDSFDFRNRVVHEYLNPGLLNDPSINRLFPFLAKCIEHSIVSLLSLDRSKIINSGYTVINNRVL